MKTQFESLNLAGLSKGSFVDRALCIDRAAQAQSTHYDWLVWNNWRLAPLSTTATDDPSKMRAKNSASIGGSIDSGISSKAMNPPKMVLTLSLVLASAVT